MPRVLATFCLLVLAAASAHAADPVRDAFSSPDPPRSIGPLLWYHGEDDALILREIDRMHDAGIGNFTIESRPHPDYLGPKWWHDLSISIERAQRLGMQVWIFDEKWFPSGVAGGLVMQADKRFWRHYLRETSARARGPQSAFTLELPENEELSALVAVPAVAEPAEMLDLRAKAHLNGRTVTCPLPEGEWDVFAYTLHSDAGHHDVLSAESTAKFIELVHEPTYEHFGKYFGNTVQGFFMDEPGFYNPGDQTPWTYDFAAGFAADKGYDLAAFLPALTHPQWSQFRWVRYDYTDYLTRRYAESFYKPIQDWCHAHGVRSIGHMFEHELTHWSLGAGSGHLFRTQRYFDMGGIDLVFHQVLEGSTNIDYWGMPKLGSSIAHVYNMPDDLAMDETYGASGWMTGLKRMKWLADWQMVRGINFLVPHAFDPTYPDPDCPPHFYAGGNNPEWPMFRHWSDYVNRVCYLLTGGKHVAPAAVLYTAESHWAGEADLVERTEAELLKAQVDFDLIPYDVLLSDCRFEDGKLRLHDEEYSLLVLPGVEALPVKVAERLRQFAEAGGTVLTSHLLPSASCDRGGDEQVRAAMRAVFGEPADGAALWSHLTAGGGKGYYARRVGQLPYLLADSGLTSDLVLYPRSPDIRYIHRVKEGRDVFFITTESVRAGYDGVVSLEAQGAPQVWNALTGETAPAPSYQRVGSRVLLPLRLAPYESLAVVFDRAPEALHVGLTDLTVIESVFRDPAGGVRVIGTAPAGSTSATAWAQDGSHVWRGRAPVPAHPAPRQLAMDGWTITRDGRTSVGALGDWAKDDPYFSGGATYEREFVVSVDECASGRTLLHLGEVGEIARVWCNGKLVGEFICPPYVADLTAAVHDGANSLRVEVTNTLSNQRVAAGEPPHYAQVLPSGLMGPVALRWEPQVQVLLAPADGGSPTLPARTLPPLRRGLSLADAGAVAIASSTLNAQYPVEAVIDGDTSGAEWEQGGGWNDATPGVWGDWVEIRLPKEQPIAGVIVTTLADDFRSGEGADSGTRFTRYGLVDFDIEVWTGEAWRTAAEVRGNDLVRREVTFAPVTTNRFRVVVRRGGEDYSRIVEIELPAR
jgi:hypothetical protein